MKMNVLLIIALFACAATTSAALRIGVLTDGESAFWTAMSDVMKEAAKEQGVEVDFRMASPATIEQQTLLSNEMVTAGAQAIAIAPINPEEQAAFLAEIAGQLPLVTVMHDVPESKRVAFLGRDEKQAGQMLAQGALSHMPPGMKVMGFCKDPESAATKARIAGLNEAFELSGTVLDGVKSDKGDRMIAWANMEEVIRTRPEVAALIGFEPYHGPALVRAVTEGARARMVRIIGFGITPETEDAMKDGVVHALVADDAAGWATLALKTLVALANNEKEDIPEDGFIAAPLKTVQTAGDQSMKEMMDELQVQAPWISEVTTGTP